MIDILLIIAKVIISLFFGLLGYLIGYMFLVLIQIIQYGGLNRFNNLSCNWMKGKKYFKPMTKEQQDWHDFFTKEIPVENLIKKNEYSQIR